MCSIYVKYVLYIRSFSNSSIAIMYFFLIKKMIYIVFDYKSHNSYRLSSFLPNKKALFVKKRAFYFFSINLFYLRIALEITSFWISEVPSPIVHNLLSL